LTDSEHLFLNLDYHFFILIGNILAFKCQPKDPLFILQIFAFLSPSRRIPGYILKKDHWPHLRVLQTALTTELSMPQKVSQYAKITECTNNYVEA